MKITISFLHLEHTPALDLKMKEASEKTNRNQHWRGEEEVELWVLKLI